MDQTDFGGLFNQTIAQTQQTTSTAAWIGLGILVLVAIAAVKVLR